MSAKNDERPEPGQLYVGKGVTVRGEVVVTDTVVVDGVLEGDITAGNLLVREEGVIRGRVAVGQNAEIFGRVLDKLDVRGLLVLRGTSRVEANVTCGTLTIEQGATISGGISSAAQGSHYASTPERRENARPGATAASPRSNFAALDMPSPINATV